MSITFNKMYLIMMCQSPQWLENAMLQIIKLLVDCQDINANERLTSSFNLFEYDVLKFVSACMCIFIIIYVIKIILRIPYNI